MSRFKASCLGKICTGLLVICSVINNSASEESNTHQETLHHIDTNSYWTAQKINPSIYDTPYRISLFNPISGEDTERAWSQTKSVFGYGFGVIGVLLIIPEEHTGWDPDIEILNNWINNITAGPKWDRNNWIYNYVGHTYFGGVYYQVIRKSGYRQWDAFIYSFLMSTFYWEYGIEAFAESPSIQDLIVTPVMGWVYGEWAYQTELKIRNADNEVLNSKTLGSLSLWLLDPVDSIGRGINRLAGRRLIEAGHGYFTYTPQSSENSTGHLIYIHMRIPLGVSGSREPLSTRILNNQNDPVNTGVVGIALGKGHSFLDRDWGIKEGLFNTISMGIYFTPKFSTRLAYRRGQFEERVSREPVTYENYSLNTQYYFNVQRKIRPYITAGFGEQMWDQSQDKKTFQWNAGIGLHLRLNRKWALQSDWIYYYGPSKKTSDINLNFGLVYRFGHGEHNNW